MHKPFEESAAFLAVALLAVYALRLHLFTVPNAGAGAISFNLFMKLALKFDW